MEQYDDSEENEHQLRIESANNNRGQQKGGAVVRPYLSVDGSSD
jgi:hypothetical protein